MGLGNETKQPTSHTTTRGPRFNAVTQDYWEGRGREGKYPRQGNGVALPYQVNEPSTKDHVERYNKKKRKVGKVPCAFFFLSFFLYLSHEKHEKHEKHEM